MKTMISNVDHGDRVASLESGFTGLEDSLDQHRNHFDSKMVKNASYLHIICTIRYWIFDVYFQNAMGSEMKDMISDVDHGHRVTALESGFTGLEDSMGQHQNDFNSKLVNSLVSMF